MLEGGIADKKGNDYEASWTLIGALRVLRGMADEIRLEPYNEDAQGFEFRITGDGIDEWHQCKRQTSNGSWTIASLIGSGVLKAFAGKLTDPNTLCVFVSSDPAPALEKLIEKALIAETAEDFFGAGGIGKGDRAALSELARAWSVDEATQFDWLKRCSVEVTSHATLQRRLSELCGLLFRTAADTVIDRLKSHLSANLSVRLRREHLAQAILDLGIEWLAQFDETLDGRINLATEEYLDSLTKTVAGIEIRTSGRTETARAALEGDRPITVIAGGAGSGKSVLVSQIVEEARSQGWPVLAFRLDRFLDVQSLTDLGQALLDAPQSPVSVFGNRNVRNSALLVIDQVDAVSEASGRSGRMRDLFFRMIGQSALFPEMRVVAACRSYDLDGDSRLEALSKSQRATTVRLKPLDWKEAVEPVLAHLGLGDRDFSERERQLLSIPINLQLFSAVTRADGAPLGNLSSSRLFDRLVEVRGRELRQAGFGWTPEAALAAMARSMSQNQQLAAPVAVLDSFSGAVDALASRGLITSIRGKLQFAHESFFDHIFARDFIATGQSVHGLLLSGEQRLFRRTQVRQIFSRLRDSSDPRYLSNLRQVMEASDVRYLVKDAIAYWLSEIDAPTSAERQLVGGWFQHGHPLERLARVIFTGRQWLEILHQDGVIQDWLRADEGKRDLALWLLNRGSVSHSESVADTLRTWWNEAPQERVSDLIAWFERLYPDGPIGSLECLYQDALEALPASSVKEKFEANFDLGSWVHKSPALGARVLALWLRKWSATFKPRHPFGDVGQDGTYWIEQLVEKVPAALLEALIPSLSEALASEREALAAGELSYPTLRPPHHRHDQEYVRSVVDALERVAVEEPDRVVGFLGALGDHSDVGLFAKLSAIAANAEALAPLLIPTLTSSRVFKVGDGDGDWFPFAKAAAAAMPYLSRADRSRLEDAVLAYRPEYDWAREYLRRCKAGETLFMPSDPKEYVIHQLSQAGRDQRAILTTIGVEYLSPLAVHRLTELDRKFPGQALPESYGVRGGFVRSPIADDRAKFLSDRQWRQAIRKYRGDERHVYEPDGVIGGARQLASVLGARAKEQPERFVAFLETLPTEANPSYAEAIVSSLREVEAPPSLVVRAVKAALRWGERDFDRMISWTLQRHPSAAVDPKLLAFLLHSAEHGTASDFAVRTTNPPQHENKRAADLLRHDNGDLSSSGINGERGSAYEALANLLWEDETVLPAVLALLERRVRHEPLASVRMCMAHVVNSIGRYEPERAIDLFRGLIGTDFRILMGHSAQHFLNWMVFKRPDMVAEFVEGMLISESHSIRAHGYFLEALLALLDDERDISFRASFEENPLRRQMAAYRAAANVTSDRFGTKAIGWLWSLIFDDDPDVRGDTTGIGWEKLLEGDDHHADFVRAFISSPTFDDHSDHLMRALEDRVSHFPDLAYYAVERVLELIEGWTASERHGHYSTLHHLGKTLVELYRTVEIGSDRERQILDQFDTYLARDLYELRGELGAYERH